MGVKCLLLVVSSGRVWPRPSGQVATTTQSAAMITASDESLSPNTENVALSVMNVHRAGHSYIGRIDLATVEAQALVQLDRAPIAHPQWCLIMDNSA